jgi:hypothetical protein
MFSGRQKQLLASFLLRDRLEISFRVHRAPEFDGNVFGLVEIDGTILHENDGTLGRTELLGLSGSI